MEKRGILHPQHEFLRAAARQRGVGMARQTLLDANSRVMQKARGGHRLCPARPCGRQTADWSGAPPASEPSQALRVPALVPLALRPFYVYPVAHRPAPLDDNCRGIGALDAYWARSLRWV
jgi:hypothetical protein